MFRIIVLQQLPRSRIRTTLIPDCRQEIALVDVAHQLGVEVLFEANFVTKAFDRKATPHVNFDGMLYGSSDHLFTRQIPDALFNLIQIHRCFV